MADFLFVKTLLRQMCDMLSQCQVKAGGGFCSVVFRNTLDDGGSKSGRIDTES